MSQSDRPRAFRRIEEAELRSELRTVSSPQRSNAKLVKELDELAARLEETERAALAEYYRRQAEKERQPFPSPDSELPETRWSSSTQPYAHFRHQLVDPVSQQTAVTGHTQRQTERLETQRLLRESAPLPTIPVYSSGSERQSIKLGEDFVMGNRSFVSGRGSGRGSDKMVQPVYGSQDGLPQLYSARSSATRSVDRDPFSEIDW